MGKVSEFFDALDLASHQGLQARYITVSDLAESVLLNNTHSVEDLLAVIIMNVHQTLKEKNMLPRIRDLFNFMNSNRDETCESGDFKRILKDLMQDRLISA
jgi:hypothetical protein